jgi:hypothetical protein
MRCPLGAAIGGDRTALPGIFVAKRSVSRRTAR